MAKFHRQLYDEAHHKMDVSGSEVIRDDQAGFMLLGSGSSGAQFLQINDEGQLVTTAAASSGSTEVTGSVLVSNFPLVQEVTGTVALEGGEITVGNFPNTQSVVFTQPIEVFGTASVAVSNFPVTTTVTGVVGVSSIASPVDVEGTFWQAVQPITGVVALEGGEITVGNFPNTQSVVFEQPINILGTASVNISNVSLPVSVSNLHAIQEVTGSAFVFGDFFQTVQPVSFTQPIEVFGTASVVVSNQPVTQAVRIVDEPVEVFFDFPIGVTGTVDATIVNFPLVQEITGTMDITSIASPVDVNVLGGIQVNVTGNTDQGLAGTIPQSWLVTLTDGSQVIGDSSAAPVFTSGSVHIQNFPSTQVITGVVELNNPLLPVSVSNLPAIQEITGSTFVFGDFYQATQPVSFVQPIEVFGTASVVVSSLPAITGTVGITSIASPVDVGNFPATSSVVYPLAPTATRSSLTASVVSTEILAVNPERKGLLLYVSSAGEDVACYVGFGTGPITTSDASYILFSNDSYTLEQPFVTAPLQAIFNMTTASVRLFITEIT